MALAALGCNVAEDFEITHFAELRAGTVEIGVGDLVGIGKNLPFGFL